MNFSIKIFKEARVFVLKNLKASDPKQFWNVLKTLIIQNNACQASLNDLYNNFKTVNEYQDDSENSVSQDDIENNEEFNKPISESEVWVAIKQLHNNKSAVLDNIENEHIKCTSNLMISIYTHLFNLIFDTAIIPESWSLGVIRPIYKKGNLKLP